MYDSDDDDDLYRPEDVIESKDPVVRRGDLLIRMAAAVDVTSNREARVDLLDYMALVNRSIACGVRQGELHSIPGGKTDGKSDQ